MAMTNNRKAVWTNVRRQIDAAKDGGAPNSNDKCRLPTSTTYGAPTKRVRINTLLLGWESIRR
jgi:hypothetical protein